MAINIGRKGTINAQETYVIGNVGIQGGSWTVHMEADGSWSGTIKVKGRATKPTNATAPLTAVQITYTKQYLNGSVADGTIVSSDITGTSLIQIVVADGIDLILDCTTYAAGSMAVQAFPSS